LLYTGRHSAQVVGSLAIEIINASNFIGSINFTPGYDVIIDQDLKPWLLEVNASPSLSANTKEDYMMKTEMLHGMLDVVDMEVGRCLLPVMLSDAVRH
jgi:Tubulin-tyrosine ligase family